MASSQGAVRLGSSHPTSQEKRQLLELIGAKGRGRLHQALDVDHEDEHGKREKDEPDTFTNVGNE